MSVLKPSEWESEINKFPPLCAIWNHPEKYISEIALFSEGDFKLSRDMLDKGYYIMFHTFKGSRWDYLKKLAKKDNFEGKLLVDCSTAIQLLCKSRINFPEDENKTLCVCAGLMMWKANLHDHPVLYIKSKSKTVHEQLSNSDCNSKGQWVLEESDGRLTGFADNRFATESKKWWFSRMTNNIQKWIEKKKEYQHNKGFQNQMYLISVIIECEINTGDWDPYDDGFELWRSAQ